MRLLLIEGLSRNDVMTLMARQLCRAFQAIGVEARTAIASPANLNEVLASEFTRGGFDGVFSFASFGADVPGPDGRSPYEALSFGFTGWNVDHPAYQFARTTARQARRLTICASEDHFRFIDLMGGRGRRLALLPGAPAELAPKAWGDRRIPVLVAMSWMGQPDRWWDEAKGSAVYVLMESMVERLIADPALDVLAAYRSSAQASGFRVPFNADISNLIARLITYIRQVDRLELIKGLQAASIPFALCGDGWEAVVSGDANVTVLPSTDMAGLTSLYGECKVVLNLNAANGASERALSAMGAGAAVASDRGVLLAESFAGQMAFYDRTNVAATIGVVGELLEGRGEAMAEQSWRSVQSAHLWTHKALAIADVLRAAFA